MASHLPLIDEDGEVGNLSKVDVGVFRPAAEVLPPDFLADLVALKKERGERGPQKSPTKVPTTIRFDADVLAALKASGKFIPWQVKVIATDGSLVE